MADRWQYIAVRRDIEEDAWLVRGPAPLQVPPEDDPLLLLNAAGAQGWELVDRQILKEFRGGPSVELIFKRKILAPPPGAAAPAAEAAPAPEAPAPEAPASESGEAPFAV